MLRDGGLGVSDAGSGGRSGLSNGGLGIDAGGLREVVLSDSGGLREGCLGLSDTGSGGRCFAGIGAASRPRAGTTSTNPPADAATC